LHQLDRALHVWRIAPREYSRHEQRRGRRHAYTSLTPARTALLVVDMVPFFVEQNPYTAGIVPHIQRLADSLRGAGGAVTWVLPGRTEPTAVQKEFLGPDIAEMFSRSGGEGPLRSRVWREFDVRDDDLLVEKTAASAFFPGRCPLHGLLEKRGVDTVLVTGTVTNVCCESTARDAHTLGYRVIMVADGCSAGTDDVHNAALHTIYRTFGDVRSTEEVIDLVEGRSTRCGIVEQS
jgi:nicotinamidase-related amidase